MTSEDKRTQELEDGSTNSIMVGQKFSNGMVISKVFHDPTTGANRRYEGIIQRLDFCKDTNRWMYLVLYPEDGDIEHMEECQVETHLREWEQQKHPKETAKPKTAKKKNRSRQKKIKVK
mmetsp:Transcript_1810/g.2666  ORF Transcript_1810/g.2666 Transcript_1810/m.2666 type:complete len:119 (+) Transcript_1810:89-445(+)